MALAAIHVKKLREAQIWNCCTGNPVLRILPDSNNLSYTIRPAWDAYNFYSVFFEKRKTKYYIEL